MEQKKSYGIKTKEVGKIRILKLNNQFLLIGLFFILCQMLTGANGLPFYDKLEFGLMMTKVVGGIIAMVSFVVGIYMHKAGRSDSLMTCVWFCGAGIITANIEWIADKFGFLSGVIF